MPRVSVVVPVRDRPDGLARLLAALAAQTYDDFEVVVVDDGSEPPVTVPPGRARVVRVSGVGAVAARRAGVEAAAGEVLAFTDSDCAPEPGWLAAGVAALDSGADLVNGRTVPDRPPAPGERGLWAGDEGLYPTCNLFVRRSAHDGVGGFDVDAGRRLGFRWGPGAAGLGFGEDTLFAWAVRRAGGRAAYAPAAVVAHAVERPGLGEALTRAWVVGAFPALVREVPELRQTLLRGGVVLGRPSRLAWYATAVALVTGRRRLAAASAAAWVAGRAKAMGPRRHGPVAVARALPVDLLCDAVGGCALVAGSLRARVPVL